MSSATDAVLTCAARLSLHTSSGEELSALSRQVCDWRYLFDEARAHGIVMILDKALRDAGIPLPADAVPVAATESATALGHSVILYAEASECLRALADQGVHPVVLKGPAVGLTLYESAADRPFTDLDALIAEQDWPIARRALLDLSGHAEDIDAERLPSTLDANETLDHMLSFRLPSGFRAEFTFDHLQLGLRGRTLGAMRADAVTVDVGGVLALMPAPHDMLLQLCVHLARHGFNRLIWWIDIARCLAVPDLVDWDRFVSRVRTESLSAVVQGVLGNVTRVLGVGAPEGVMNALSPSRLQRAVWAHYWPESTVSAFAGVHEGPLVFLRAPGGQGSAAYLASTASNLILTGRAYEKAAALTHLAFPPREHLELRHGTPSESYTRMWGRRLTRRLQRERVR